MTPAELAKAMMDDGSVKTDSYGHWIGPRSRALVGGDKTGSAIANENTTGPTIGDVTAPRITPADIEANIACELYGTADQLNDQLTYWSGDQMAVVPPSSGLMPDSARLLTFCVLVLRNGFTVTGESHCLNPDNFDAEEGRKWARQQAVDKIGPLMAYSLKERMVTARMADQLSPEEIKKIMAMGAPPAVFNVIKAQECGQTLAPYQQRVVIEKAELDERLAKLDAFLDGVAKEHTPVDSLELLYEQAHAMRIYRNILGKRIARFTGGA